MSDDDFKALERSYYALLRENEKLKLRPEWIKSSDELPNEGHVVIVSSGVAFMEEGEWYNVTAEGFPGTLITWEVEYWMSIPEQPIKPFEEFPFLKEGLQGTTCTDATEALFLTQETKRGKEERFEKGIVFETKNGNIALQLSELKMIVQHLER